MDWLDTYLDGLGQYKTTVSPSDTHIWGEKPNLNNQQKRMLFDAAAQSELEYRLIVQEARQAEIDAGMGGSYDAGSAARERPATPATPSGIVVATTNAVNITGNNTYVPDGTYTKVTANGTRVAGSAVSDKLFLDTGVVYLKEAGYSDADFPFKPYGHILVAPNTTFTATFFSALATESRWYCGKVFGNDDGEGNYEFIYQIPNINESTDATTIPTSGWTYGITITAA